MKQVFLCKNDWKSELRKKTGYNNDQMQYERRTTELVQVCDVYGTQHLGTGVPRNLNHSNKGRQKAKDQ